SRPLRWGNAGAKAVLSRGEALIPSDHVVVETGTFIRRRLGRRPAERFQEAIRLGAATIEAVGTADMDSAWEIGKSYRDQDFSIVDRTSFGVMRRLGIERAASLDDDFAIFRFGPNRRLAFTVPR